METPSTVFLWLSEQAGPLAFIASLLALILGILYLSARHRRRRMNVARAGVTVETFVLYLSRFGFDPLITRATYRYLQETQQVRFPIYPSDLLDEDLGLDTAAIAESERDLFVLTGRSPRPGLRRGPIATVEDLVRLLQASPRIDRRRAA